MENNNILLDAYNSVVKYLQDCREDIMEKEITNNLEFRDLDGHGEDFIIKNEDYLFIKDFSGEIDDEFHDWVFNVGVSTFDDENLFRHRAIMNYILNHFLPRTTIPIYKTETGEKKKLLLIVKGSVMLQPFSKYNTRAVQYLLVNVASTETTHGRQPLDHT